MSSELLKKKVKARMLQHAARLWGAEEVDIETTFDPLVAMLIEACANEVEKVNDAIENTHTRVVDHIARLLTPDTIIGCKPAHAIVHASPTESKCTLRPEMQFCFNKKTHTDGYAKDESSKDVFFSPVGAFQLVNADVRYLVFGNYIYENISTYQKKVVGTAEGNKHLKHGSYWIGLETNDSTTESFDASFYFDLRNNYLDKNTFLHLLPLAKWNIDGFPLNTTTGLILAEDDKNNKLQNEFDADQKLTDEIRALYDTQFVTVHNLVKENRKLPEKLATTFSKKDLLALFSKCIWINIEFPTTITEEMMNDLLCCVNCFPVVNRKLNEFTFKLSQQLNIVPLKSIDDFLSVKGVYSQEGIAYTNGLINHTRDLSEGTYLIRQGGVERFDSRNATEIINHLLNLLRDENGAFTVLGNEFISSNLKVLAQTLAIIEQRMERKGDAKELSRYLFVNPLKSDDNILVSFWTTDGEFANSIKAGSILELYNSCELQSDSIMLLTTTRGSRARLDDRDRLYAFRASLLSRDRIITPQDIKLFCLRELGNEIEDVTTRKGYIISNDRNNGFIQTVDVWLHVLKDSRFTAVEWSDICEDLSINIMKHSAELTPIRVMVK